MTQYISRRLWRCTLMICLCPNFSIQNCSAGRKGGFLFRFYELFWSCKGSTYNLLSKFVQFWYLFRYENVPEDKQPFSLASAIKDSNWDLFPNIYVLLQLACTLPAISCKCEQSASVLKHFNTYIHASMGQERLSSLALLHIHYDHTINTDNVVNIYSCLHPRRMELYSLIKS